MIFAASCSETNETILPENKNDEDNSAETDTIEDNLPPAGIYIYDGETELTIEDRFFLLEALPQNIAEDVVVRDFLYTITAEFDKKREILADIESHNISITNEKRNFAEEIYVQSYVIHDIATLTEEQYNQRETADGEHNRLFYYGVEKRIEDYNLIEYEIVNVDFTKVLSPKSNERGPHWGDGTYNRSFIVGMAEGDSSYKIYDFGMM